MSKTLNIKTKSGAEINIPINNKVTIITGDSATGKTKMINNLLALQSERDEIASTTVNFDSMIICKDADKVINVMKNNIKNKLIIIDEYDSISLKDQEKIIKFIQQSENLFIICTHKPLKKCGYDYSSILSLKHDGTNYNAIQLFEYPSDYIVKRDVLI